MRLSSRKRSPGDIEYGIIFGSIAVIVLVAARVFPVLSLFPTCVFRSVTSRPCPTCGSTRALLDMAHGHIGEALLMNPLVTVIIAAAMIGLAANAAMLVFGLRRPVLIFSAKDARYIRLTAISLFLSNWAYLVFTNR